MYIKRGVYISSIAICYNKGKSTNVYFISIRNIN